MYKLLGEARERFAQPDGLLWVPEQSKLVVVEVKYSHTEEAWKKLFGVYMPLVKHMFGDQFKVTACEVVKWHDPVVSGRIPTRCQLRERIDSARVGELAIHIWKPQSS